MSMFERARPSRPRTLQIGELEITDAEGGGDVG
jgi:hypothetical protein